VKASPEDQARLLDLQALDTKLAQLTHREKNLPEAATIAELGKQADAVRVTLAGRQGELEDARIELKRVESDVATVRARIDRDSERLQGSSSVKDVAALEQELTALRRRLDDLEDIQLSVMERVEEHEAAAAQTDAELGGLAARILESEEARDRALAAIAAERKDAATDRGTIADGLPSDLVELYERQRTRYGTGASLLRGGVSLASGVALNRDELQKVRSAAPDDVLICPSSDAILVRTDESGL